MISYDEINDLIIKAFNYYNGKINPINKAVLDINWANLSGSDIGGYSRLPNIIDIHPMVIYRFYNHDDLAMKVSIIATIIHELYHTDQLINYKLYVSDPNYNSLIEHACETQTSIYLAGHIQELYNVFGIDGVFDRNDFNKNMMYWDLPGVRYQRRYYHDHIFMCIDDMCDMRQDIAIQVYDFIKYNVEHKKDIIININGEIINVCINKRLMPIDEFNKIFIKYICTGIHNVKHVISYNRINKKITIDLETELLNIMCKKV